MRVPCPFVVTWRGDYIYVYIMHDILYIYKHTHTYIYMYIIVYVCTRGLSRHCSPGPMSIGWLNAAYRTNGRDHNIIYKLRFVDSCIGLVILANDFEYLKVTSTMVFTIYLLLWGTTVAYLRYINFNQYTIFFLLITTLSMI